MSTLEINKIIAAVLTAGVVAMMSGFIAEIVYEIEPLEEPAYKVVVGEEAEEAGPAAPAEAKIEPVAPLLAAADPGAGQKIAKKCTACHTLEQGGPHKIGPNLWNVVNRPIASAEGFSYSGALQEKADQTWSYQNLNAFLTKPKDWAAGTKMSFAGIKKAEDRAGLIAFLRTLSENPAPLPQ